MMIEIIPADFVQFFCIAVGIVIGLFLGIIGTVTACASDVKKVMTKDQGHEEWKKLGPNVRESVIFTVSCDARDAEECRCPRSSCRIMGRAYRVAQKLLEDEGK
jgi:hypothetical protein